MYFSRQTSILPINQIELVVCDVVSIDQNLTFEKEFTKKVT